MSCVARTSHVRFCAVYAFRFYTWSQWAAFSNNISIWVSPTEVWTNGSLCVSNFSPAATNLVHNFIPCAKPISNTRYVTVTKPLADGANGVSQYLYIWELQILRAGEAPIVCSVLGYKLVLLSTG